MKKKLCMMLVIAFAVMSVISGCSALQTKGKDKTPEPTGYAAGEVQRTTVFYDGKLYWYDSDGFDKALEKGFEMVGEVEKIDNKNLPAEEFCGSRIDMEQEIYANPADATRIFVKYDKGYAVFKTE